MAIGACNGVLGGTPECVEEQQRRVGSSMKLKAFCLPEVQIKWIIVHFCYPVNCTNILFFKEYSCIAAWVTFIVCNAVTKSRRWKELRSL